MSNNNNNDYWLTNISKEKYDSENYAVPAYASAPKKTDEFTTAQLQDMGMVGVYTSVPPQDWPDKIFLNNDDYFEPPFE